MININIVVILRYLDIRTSFTHWLLVFLLLIGAESGYFTTQDIDGCALDFYLCLVD